MSRRKTLYILCGATLVVVAGVVGWLVLEGRMPTIESPQYVPRAPSISPDYVGVTIPPNIAPMNFVIKEPGEVHCVFISSTHGEPIHLHTHDAKVSIPASDWHALLEANRGEELTIEIFARSASGEWHRFQPIVNVVAEEGIDRYLVYRDMDVYNLAWTDMGIYQRDIETFDRREVLRNTGFGQGCCNCHTFRKNHTDLMLMNVRPSPDPEPGGVPGGMVLVRDGVVERIVNTKTAFNPVPAIYLAWHPNGRVVAFSTNRVMQIFNTTGETRWVVDAYSDMALYLVDSNTVTTCPAIASDNRRETYPAWSPDGTFLYYCSAPQPRIEEMRKDGKNAPVLFYSADERYDLMRIHYDADTGTWGEPETVFAASDVHRSIALPRVSPDGRFLLCCVMDKGNFAPFSRSSDLFMLDLTTSKRKELNVNSPFADMYHSWSSSGRWVVFTSKRGDGEFSRLYFSHVDEQGRMSKPFLLPQEDPAFYETSLRIFNVPELIVEPVGISQRDLLRALYSPGATVNAKLDPHVKPNTVPLKAFGKWKSSGPPIQ